MKQQHQDAYFNLVYFQFLMKVLQATQESNSDAKVIYPLLAANIDKLDCILADTLRRWGKSQLEKLEADVAKSIANVIVEFGTLIQEFSLGDEASNMEIAIACYETVLEVYIDTAFPKDWESSQNNLGIPYRDTILEDKADDIEKAIDSYNRKFFFTSYFNSNSNLASDESYKASFTGIGESLTIE